MEAANLAVRGVVHRACGDLYGYRGALMRLFCAVFLVFGYNSDEKEQVTRYIVAADITTAFSAALSSLDKLDELLSISLVPGTVAIIEPSAQ